MPLTVRNKHSITHNFNNPENGISLGDKKYKRENIQATNAASVLKEFAGFIFRVSH
jgi:hypothetical protein